MCPKLLRLQVWLSQHFKAGLLCRSLVSLCHTNLCIIRLMIGHPCILVNGLWNNILAGFQGGNREAWMEAGPRQEKPPGRREGRYWDGFWGAGKNVKGHLCQWAAIRPSLHYFIHLENCRPEPCGGRGREISGVGGSGGRRGERVMGNHQRGCLEEERQEVWYEKKGGKREG